MPQNGSIVVGVPDRASVRQRATFPNGVDVVWLGEDEAGLESAWATLPAIEFLAGPPWVNVAKLRFGADDDGSDGRGLLRRALAEMSGLRAIQGFSAGPQWLRPLVPDGVTLCDAQGVHSIAVAEWTLMALLAVTRKLPWLHDAQREERWITQSRARYDGDSEVFGSRVMILGHGSIGQAVEQRLRCFEADIIRVARTAREGTHGVEDLHDLLPEMDSVLIHLPETDETRGLVDERFLGRMKEGSILINASRGALVDNEALLAALRAGRIRAAIDNTDPEPLPDGHVLWSAPNLLITPHVGSRSPRAHDRLTRLLYDQLDRYVKGAPLANVVEGAY